MPPTEDQRIIRDTLRAAFRSSPLLFDNLGIKINRDEAFRDYAERYNKTPRVLVNGTNLISPVFLPKETYLDPKKLNPRHQVLAILRYAHIQAEKWGQI